MARVRLLRQASLLYYGVGRCGGAGREEKRISSKMLGQLLGDGVGVGWMNFFQKRLEHACSPASAAWRVEEGVGAGVGGWVDK